MAEKAAPPTRILVVDDEPDVRDLLKETLETYGFAVKTAVNGAEGLRAIRADPPDIAVLDLQMPEMDGFAVCRELRRDPLFAHLPVIILSATGTGATKVEGLNLGADDFITKPVDNQELLARIRMIIRRTRQGLDANPLTRLPGNVSIENRIESELAADRPLAVLYLDINQFKAFNDAYGYEAGDQVIKATARLLIQATRERDGSGDFVGHIGGDDFIVVTTPERMEAMAQRIIRDFDAMAPGFYNEDDRRRGRIVSTDRQGRLLEFPFVSIAIGICHNRNRRLTSHAQIAQYGAELKKFAKQQPGSAYVLDRRRD